MKIERNFSKRLRMHRHLESVVHRIFMGAKKDKQTFERILENLKTAVYQTNDYQKIGEINRANIAGHIAANFTLHYYELVWVCWYDGKFMGKTKDFKYEAGFDQNLMRTGYVYKGAEIEFNERKK